MCVCKAEDAAMAMRSMNRVIRLKSEINDLLPKEEKMWKQRSRALWLHKGDNNTMKVTCIVFTLIFL